MPDDTQRLPAIVEAALLAIRPVNHQQPILSTDERLVSLGSVRRELAALFVVPNEPRIGDQWLRVWTCIACNTEQTHGDEVE